VNYKINKVKSGMEKPSKFSFSGQQEGERIISTITPHKIALIIGYIKAVGVSILFLICFVSLGRITSVFVATGILISIFTLVIGILICNSLYLKRITYITDRRIIRFEPSNIFVINSRSLTWDNILKVKTFPTNFLFRLMNIGSVIVHSKTTLTGDNSPNQILIGNDDIILKSVYFYKDFGNYIDKIIYLYSHDKNGLETMRPFVGKKRGQRY
jgi:hypothetical protein